MCGIAGFIVPARLSNWEKMAERMLHSLRRRGPDDEGLWQSEFTGSSGESWRIVLLHRRLSIIDIKGGHQPLTNLEKTYTTVFNGEIFNFKQLREQLQQQGIYFQTNSDTEVLLQQFVHFGNSGLHQLDGMFAFGIWNRELKELTLARDAVGIKPICYSEVSFDQGKGFVFASDLETLMEAGLTDRRVQPGAVRNYLFSEYIQAPFTFIQGVKKLQPGQVLNWSPERVQLSSFTIEQKKSDHQVGNIQAVLGVFDKLFSESVNRQLISDVPVGVLLSGGLDSSSIVSMVSRCTKEKIQTFSVEFEDPDFDEGELARRIANQFHTVHHALRISENDLLDHLEKSLTIWDEPISDPSIIPTSLLCQLASQHVKVVLGGDGGDELFGGYPTYYAHRYADQYSPLGKFINPSIKRLLSFVPSQNSRWSLEWKLKRFFGRWDSDAVKRHLKWMAGSTIEDVIQLVNETDEPQFWSEEIMRENLQDLNLNSKDPNLFMMIDFNSYLPSQVLAKVDRASMHWGLEVRPPFLSSDLICFAQGLDSTFKVRGNQTKYLLREYARIHIGSWLSSVPKKGFGIPLNKWMRSSLKSIVLERVVQNSEFHLLFQLNGVTIKKLWTDLETGQNDTSRTLWALLVLQVWSDRVFKK